MNNFLTIHQQQRQIILNLIRKYQPVSRGKLKMLSGIRLGTVGNLVEELKKEGLIQEDFQKRDRRGRRPGLLRINRQGRLVVGLELSQKAISGILMDLGAGVIKTERKLLPEDVSKGKIFKMLDEVISLLLFSTGNIPVAGLGFVDPGMVDFQRGVSIYSTILPAWRNVPVKKILEESYRFPVIVSNSQQAKAIAEHCFGQAKGVDNFVYVEYGEGIACGIFLEGRPIRGQQFVAGELGHTRIPGENKKCRCGRYGCIEALCCFPVMEKLVQKKDKDILSKRIGYLAVSIGNLVNLLNPALVILDGNFLRLGKEVVTDLLEKIKEEILPEMKSQLKVTISTLGPETGALGAAASLLEEFFSCGFYQVKVNGSVKGGDREKKSVRFSV